MSEATETAVVSLGPTLGLRLDQTCNRFESAWCNGDRPCVDDFLPAPGDDLYSILLGELIYLDIFYRRRQGEEPVPKDYLSRYPDLTLDQVGGAFRAGPASAQRSVLASICGRMPTTVGRYRIREELGRGGFGIVFLAEDTTLHRDVALKLPRPEMLAEPELRQRFLREARAAAGLDHPNVVPVYDSGEADGICYIAAAYCGGGNLAAWLRRQTEPVPPRRAAALVAALARAVQHAHERGVLHRDLKPANVLLVPLAGPTDGAGELSFIPKLTDFGLARIVEEADTQTTCGVLVGTPAYMAPEQAAGWSRQVGPATDVYALGVILYEIVTGRTPSQGESLLRTLDQIRSAEPLPPRQMRPDVPRDLEVICLRCLQKSPRDRYASAAALTEDLERFLRGELIRARPVGLLEHVWRWCRRPDRIGEASVVAGFFGAIGTLATTYGLVSAIIGTLAVSSLPIALAYQSGILCLYGLPTLVIAVRTAARDVRALWSGLLVPICFLVLQTAVFFQAIPTGGMVDFTRNPGAWQAQFATIWCLGMIQIVWFAIALVAYHANREQPGFLPRARAAEPRGFRPQ